jgi:DNA-binding NtrC family response regulator
MPPDSAVAKVAPMILVVEDMTDLRNCVSEYFRSAGFEVFAAENAQDALAAIHSGIHIDLVFSDVNMPGAMDGVGLANWLSVNRPGMPIILTSGKSCPEAEHGISRRRFVRKPYLLDEVEHDIRDLIELSLRQ